MTTEQEQRDRALREKYARELGVDGDDPPIEITWTIGIQAALGEDYDPEKIRRVLGAYTKWANNSGAFFKEVGGVDVIQLSPELQDRMAEIFKGLWREISDILGPEDFERVFDMPPPAALAIMDALAHDQLH